MSTEFNYAEEVNINLDQLDVEWQRHPKLVIKYNEAKADALRDADLAKEALDITIAEVDTAIREEAEETTAKKPTETAIAKMILLSDEVKTAKANYIDAKHRVNLLTAACEGFNARGQALSNAVKLWLASYFAEPESDIEDRGNVRQMMQDKMTKTATNKIKINKPVTRTK